MTGFVFDSADRVVIIGGGPSVTWEDVDYCRGKAYTIAVNDAYRLAPWADMLYACDNKWWNWHKPQFSGRRVTQDRKAAITHGIEWIEAKEGVGLSKSRDYIHQGKNSGFQALNIAYLMNAKEIYLLGFDMQASGKSHWFGEHPNRVRPDYSIFIQAFTESVEQLRGVKVVNCSMNSALTMFPVEHIAACI